MDSSAKGTLRDEHSLSTPAKHVFFYQKICCLESKPEGQEVSATGQNHSDRLSPSPQCMGDLGGFIMLRISRKGVCKHPNSLRLKTNHFICC